MTTATDFAGPSAYGASATSGAARHGSSRNAVSVAFAAYLGWTLDAFDFFIMVFVLREVAATFGVPIGDVATAITLTLAFRAVGAVVFGRLADRFGRRPVLMLNVVCFAAVEFCSGLAPTLTTFLVLRALYGVAMGGEWGVSASLVMESVPVKWRGLASGCLQAGYPSGYLLAALLYLALPYIGWRGMFFVGILPALLAFYVRRSVQESSTWEALTEDDRKTGVWTLLRQNMGLALFAIALMTALNFFAHGAEDLYPSEFLGVQHKLPTDTISTIMIISNIGALIGGPIFGLLSERIGRKRAIALAIMLTLPVLPFWATAATPAAMALTSFVLMACMQGAWGVIPVYLNELSPPEVRATFPGFVYQAGNFLAAANVNIQIWLAGDFGHDFGLVMGLTVAVTAIIAATLAACGREPKGARMDASAHTARS